MKLFKYIKREYNPFLNSYDATIKLSPPSVFQKIEGSIQDEEEGKVVVHGEGPMNFGGLGIIHNKTKTVLSSAYSDKESDELILSLSLCPPDKVPSHLICPMTDNSSYWSLECKKISNFIKILAEELGKQLLAEEHLFLSENPNRKNLHHPSSSTSSDFKVDFFPCPDNSIKEMVFPPFENQEIKWEEYLVHLEANMFMAICHGPVIYEENFVPYTGDPLEDELNPQCEIFNTETAVFQKRPTSSKGLSYKEEKEYRICFQIRGSHSLRKPVFLKLNQEVIEKIKNECLVTICLSPCFS